MKTRCIFTLISCMLVKISVAGQGFVLSDQRFPIKDTYQITLGDIDNDGDLDAVFANTRLNQSSTVWLNDGHGKFTNSGQTLISQCHGVALNDLNNDGYLDAFMVCVTLGIDNVSYYMPSKIYLNDKTGHFIDTEQNLGDLLLSANGVVLADIDSDGDQDAQVVYYDELTQSSFIKFFTNDGNGNFVERNSVFPANSDLTWNDLDGDGDMDAFVKTEGQGYSVLLNEGNMQFTSSWVFPDTLVSNIKANDALEDLDGDGDRDIFIINKAADRSLPAKVFYNDGAGHFTDSGQNLGNFDSYYWPVAGDLDNDGDLDIFLSVFLQPNQVWLNDGSGHFRDSGFRLGASVPHRGMALGDLDGDGDLDAVVANFANGSNEIWFNETISAGIEEEGIRKQGALDQNIPNPFHTSTTINFEVSDYSKVNLSVFDHQGRIVVELVNSDLYGGKQTAVFDGNKLASGIYYYKMFITGSGGRTSEMVKRMVLQR